MKTRFLLLALMWISLHADAQDVEQVVKASPLKVTGNVNLSSNYIHDDRLQGFNSPFGYFASLNLNFNFFGAINMPCTFLYSDQQASFNRPSLALFGISPSYKWLTLHLGYRNYTYSPYIMSGRQVRGIGVEMTPGVFHFSAFRGRLARQYNFGFNDPSFAGEGLTSYERRAVGGKIGLGNGANYAHLSFVKINDELGTGSAELDTLGILPEENVALGLHMGLSKRGWFSLKSNIVASVVSEDLNAETVDIGEGVERLTSPILSPNESTRHAFAYDAHLSFFLGRTTLGLRYQHIDPNYKALGVTFLQPDLDNYTVTASTSLLRSALTINASIGFQNNNANSIFENSNKRFIANANANWRVSSRININGGYNNFNSRGDINVQEVNDSLSITTNNVGYNGSMSYQMGGDGTPTTVTVALANNTFDIVNSTERIAANTSINYSLSVSNRRKSSGLVLGAGANYNRFTNQVNAQTTRYGLSIRLRKKLGDKWQWSVSPRYNVNLTNGIRDGRILNLRSNINYRLSDKSSLSLLVSYRRRATTILSSFDQLRLGASCNFRF